MPTQNQMSTQPFENNLILNALAMDDKTETVYDYSGGYNVLEFITSKTSTSRQVDGDGGVFQDPIMGISNVQGQVLSTAVNGALLRVNFTDPSYDKFRPNVVVTDGSAARNQGRIVNCGAGYIEIETTDGSAWNAATQFLANSYPTAIYNAQVARGSGAMASLYEYPDYVTNRTSIYRENVGLYSRDRNKTWVKYKGDYWYSSQDMIMMQRIAREMEYRAMFSKYGVNGTVGYNMGLWDAVINPDRGGIYRPLANLMTQGDFENFINAVADRQNSGETSITMLVGRGFLSRFQGFTQPYVQYGGNTNTFGGTSVVGLNVMSYGVNGITVNLIQAPILNDRTRFPALSSIAGSGNYTRMSYTGIVLDTSQFESIGGGMLPAMQKVYFGDTEDVYYYTPGVMGSNLQGSSGAMFTSGNFRLATNHSDGDTLGYYTDSGYNFMPYKMGIIELAA